MLILIITLIFCLWIAYETKKHSKQNHGSSEEFWNRESEANFARPVDISGLPYLKIPFDDLPFLSPEDDKELSACEERIKELANKELLNLGGLSNTDIRLTYGAKNFDRLAACDQNYSLFLRELDKWAHLLYERSHMEQAQQVLEYAVSIQSDLKKTYLLLAKIYHENGENGRIDLLSERASQLNTLLKDAILTGLAKYRDS